MIVKMVLFWSCIKFPCIKLALLVEPLEQPFLCDKMSFEHNLINIDPKLTYDLTKQ